MAPFRKAVRLSSVSQELFRESGDSDTYTGSVDDDWTVGNVAHGGYVLALIVQAAIEYQRKARQTDVVHVSAHYLQAVTVAPCEVQVKRLRTGKGIAHVLAELSQEGRTRTTVHLIFAAPSPVPQLTLEPPSPYARRIPLHHHPRHAAIAPLPGKMRYSQHLHWAPDRTVLARNAPGSPSRTRSGDIGRGGFEWGGWLQLRDPAERITPALLPFIADVFLSSPSLLAQNSPGEQGNAPGEGTMGPSWFPTLSLALQYRFPIPPPDSPHHAKRTLGVYFSGRYINDGRHDATVEVWTAPAELGEGAETADWREHQRCLAMATHLALIVPFSVNSSMGNKAAKL